MVQRVVNYLDQFEDEGVREAFEERAAILEFEAGLSKARAERLAFLETIETYGCHVKEHTVDHVEADHDWPPQISHRR